MLMNNPVDKLFERKLSEYAMEPSANAWTRIAENLPKKNRGILWFRAAAGIAIAGLAVLLWFYSSSTETEVNQLAQETNPVEIKKEVEPVLENNGYQQTDNTQKKKEKVMLANKEEKKANQEHKPVQVVNIHEDLRSEQGMEVAILESAETSVEKILQTENKVLEEGRKQEKPIVIVYELTSRQIPENPLELDLTPQKKSGFKKVLEIANDVRTGESPLGGLRQAKDEIFAFNFKKEDKNNNK